MIGEYYFATGIQIYQCGDDWIAKVEFEDLGHAEIGSMKGSLSTKYKTNLLDSAKVVYDDSRKLGIQIKLISGNKPHLYVKQLEVNTPEVWHEIRTVGNELGLEIVNCL